MPKRSKKLNIALIQKANYSKEVKTIQEVQHSKSSDTKTLSNKPDSSSKC